MIPSPSFDPRTKLHEALRNGQPLQLFSDFDGTLVPIVPDPLHIPVSPALRTTLQQLSEHPRVKVALVSGRDLGNLQDRVNLENLAYAGNHGLEITGPGFAFQEPTATRLAGPLADIVARLREVFAHESGVTVQNKHLSATIHVAKVPSVQRAAIFELLQEHTGAFMEQFSWHAGVVTFDLRPRVDWHKGTAVTWLRQRWNEADALPIFLGDDPTDEDGFEAVADGVTVLVGPDRETRARYRLADPPAVAEFLAWLLEELE